MTEALSFLANDLEREQPKKQINKKKELKAKGPRNGKPMFIVKDYGLFAILSVR